MNPQILPSPTPKKVAFSPVRLGPSESQSRPGTPPTNGNATTPRSILKTSNVPLYNHENDVSVVLDNSAISLSNNGSSGANLQIYVQRLLVAKEEERLYAYSSLYSALKQDPNMTGVNEILVRSALDTVLKDMESSESIVIKQTSVRCLGFILNYSALVNKLGVSDISTALNTIVKLLNETQAKSIYTLCIWCLAMQRISKRVLDPHVPLITKAVISALNPRLKSAKAQMEALAALDFIFSQDPNRFATWANVCFSTIVQCLTHSLSPLRRKAAVVLTKMLPKIWSEPALLSSAIQIFLRDHATKFTEEMTKMIEESPEDQDTMQIWALMVMIMGSSLHRSRFLNGMIRVAEKSFQCRRSDANVNTFKAWSALIYNFRLKNHLLHENRLKLVKLPIEAGLKEEKHVSVRIAATRAWISLVYACNDDLNQTFVFNAVIRDFVFILSKDKSPVILDLLYNTLAALMNGHVRKVSRVSLMNVFARGIDLQPTDLLPIPPTVVRDQHQVIIESLKHGIGHAAVKLDNRADLTIKKSYMETWQALIRTYRDLYQKEIRPSTAYVDAIHTCLEFLAFVILGEENDQQGFKDRLFIFKHLLKAMMDILSPNFLALRSFQLPMNPRFLDNSSTSDIFKQKKFVPIVYFVSIFIVGIARRRQEAYDDFVETICELSGACRQSSESFQDLVSLIECDFMPLTPATNPDANTREVLNLKLKMGCSCIRHEFGSLYGTKCSLPETEEAKQAIARLLSYPLSYMSVHNSHGLNGSDVHNYISESHWLGLFNAIANLIPDCIFDIARYMGPNIMRTLSAEEDQKTSSAICWLEFCSGQISQMIDHKLNVPCIEPEIPLDVENIPSIQLALLSLHEQLPTIVQRQFQKLELLPLLSPTLDLYFSAVVQCLTFSYVELKHRAAVAVRHLSCWQKVLCDSSGFIDEGTKSQIIRYLLQIMTLLTKLTADDATRDIWARSLNELVNSTDSQISAPFVEELARILHLKSCKLLLEHPTVESILSALGMTSQESNITQSSSSTSTSKSPKRTSNTTKRISTTSPNSSALRPAKDGHGVSQSLSLAVHLKSSPNLSPVSTDLSADMALDVPAHADRSSNEPAAATTKHSSPHPDPEPMILSAASPTNEPLIWPQVNEGITDSTATPLKNPTLSCNPEPMVVREAGTVNDCSTTQHHTDHSIDTPVTPTTKLSSNPASESMASNKTRPAPEPSSGLSNTVDFTDTPSTLTRKRTWSRASEEEFDVVDLTNTSPKRAKPSEGMQSEEAGSWSPKPTSGTTPSQSQDAAMLPVSSLLRKAVDGKAELEQMNVGDLLSCQQLLNQLNMMITDSLTKSLK